MPFPQNAKFKDLTPNLPPKKRPNDGEPRILNRLMQDKITADMTPLVSLPSPEDKLRAAEDLRWAAWRLKAAWLREIHPDWPELRIEDTVREIFLHA